MSNEELAKKILKMFKKDMSPERRHLLIRLYNACLSNKNMKKDLNNNLIQIEASFNNVKEQIKNYHPDVPSNIKYVDADSKLENKNKYFEIDINRLNEMKKLNKKFKASDESNVMAEKNIESEYKFQSKILEYYIMLDDCIKNYDEENVSLKRRTMQLLTDMEILLKIPVTYPSLIPSCVDDLIEESKEEKGGGGLGK